MSSFHSLSSSSHSTPTTTTSQFQPYDREGIEVHIFEDHPLHDYYSQSSGPPTEARALMSSSSQLLICSACGTQFDTADRALLTRCRICDDPRQFAPSTGQEFTTLEQLRREGGSGGGSGSSSTGSGGNYENLFQCIDGDERFWSIWTQPKIAIGQRCILIKTPLGNVLWDCITFLDRKTTNWIHSQGGLAAIVISHPHYYTSHLEWAEAFDCPVYLSWEDKAWLNRLDRMGKARTFIEGTEEEIEIRGRKSGVVVLKPGGHFPGSLVCLAYGRLLVADTLVTSPSGRGDWSRGPGGGKGGRPEGMSSFAFMWSIPNMIPLSADEIAGMWKVLRKHEFSSTHGAFVGTDIKDGYGGSETPVKQRVLDSMKIQIRRMGWHDHALLKES